MNLGFDGTEAENEAAVLFAGLSPPRRAQLLRLMEGMAVGQPDTLALIAREVAGEITFAQMLERI